MAQAAVHSKAMVLLLLIRCCYSHCGISSCSLFCYVLLYVNSSFTIIFMGKRGRERELVDLLSMSSWCLVIVVWLFLAVPRVCLPFVIVLFLDHTHYY